jgi:hypothetical protein
MLGVIAVLQNLIATALWEIGRRTWLMLGRRRFGRVFGIDAARGRLSIALGVLEPPGIVTEHGEQLVHIFPKPGSNPPATFSASKIISNCEVRASNYLIESVAVNAGNWSMITTDAEIQHQNDLSFISIGLLNNHKTVELLANPANTLVAFAIPRFISKASGRLIIQNENAVHDHGLILKIRPSNQPHRTWICCAGLGEWGTSAAAWYLTPRGREIYKKFKDRSFAIILRVTPGSDDSVEPVVEGATPQEIDRYARG